MKPIAIVFSIVGVMAICEPANAATIVDSLNEPLQSQYGILYNQWIGAEFRMPSNFVNYRLDSVTFTMAGYPVEDLSARIYSSDGTPSTLLGELSVPPNYVEPFILNYITPPFPASGVIPLAPDSLYYVVLARTDPNSSLTQAWNAIIPTEPFEALTGQFAVSHDQGQTWGVGLRNFKIRIDVVPIPEPSTVTFAAMGLVGLIAFAWRRER